MTCVSEAILPSEPCALSMLITLDGSVAWQAERAMAEAAAIRKAGMRFMLFNAVTRVFLVLDPAGPGHK